jgi:hypothetical protein
MPRHLIEAELVDLTTYGGDWDASSGAFPAGADTGDIYHVSVGGTLDSITFEVGDFIMAEVASPSTTTFSGSWLRINYNDPEIVRYKGTWAPSGGSFPGGGTALIGSVYLMSDSGIVDSVSFNAGDLLIAIADAPSTATFAGNWRRVSTASPSIIQDTDGDTKIQVEEIADEDTIRFDVAGTELMTLEATNGLTLFHDIVFDTAVIGVVLEAPDGGKWRVEVDNSGNLTAASA